MLQSAAVARVTRRASAGIGALVALVLSACEASPPLAPEGHVAVSVNPLTLTGVGDVVWDLEVRNGASPAQPVWQGRLVSSRHGDGTGAVSYVAPCDASQGSEQHVVRLWVVGVYGAVVSDPGQFAGGSTDGPGAVTGSPLAVDNPTLTSPLERSVRCEAHADARVDFDVTLARPASQGFFDVAVSFGEVFCSAKLDCCQADATGSTCASDLALLYDESGARATTMVLGFACVGPQVELHLDSIQLDCTSPADGFTVDLAVDPSGAPGNQCSAGAIADCPAVTAPGALDADQYLFQVGVYRGASAQAGGSDGLTMAHWNVALGVRRPAIEACWLRTRATASDEALDTGGVVPAGAVYPYVRWDAPLDACVTEPLTFGDPEAMVRTEYTSTAGGGTAFAYTSDADAVTSERCGAPCVAGTCVGGECRCPTPDAVAPAPSCAAAVSSATVLDIEAGAYHTCAIMGDRSVRCWGRASDGQLGDGDVEGYLGMGRNPIPVTALGTSQVRQLAAGTSHTCALLLDGTVHCWATTRSGSSETARPRPACRRSRSSRGPASTSTARRSSGP